MIRACSSRIPQRILDVILREKLVKPRNLRLLRRALALQVRCRLFVRLQHVLHPVHDLGKIFPAHIIRCILGQLQVLELFLLLLRLSLLGLSRHLCQLLTLRIVVACG